MIYYVNKGIFSGKFYVAAYEDTQKRYDHHAVYLDRSSEFVKYINNDVELFNSAREAIQALKKVKTVVKNPTTTQCAYSFIDK